MSDWKKELLDRYGYMFDSVGILYPRSRVVSFLEITPRFLVSLESDMVRVSDGVYERTVPCKDVVVVGDIVVSRLISDYERGLRELNDVLNRLLEIEKELRKKNLAVLLPKDISTV